MSGDFNPYHRWLGIPLAEQPPSHYRLLGIAPLESDPEVIAIAADRQIAHVRNFQSGPFEVEAEKLLNELAAAQVCLLNHQKKQAYDEHLRQARSSPAWTAGPAPTLQDFATRQPVVQPDVQPVVDAAALLPPRAIEPPHSTPIPKGIPATPAPATIVAKAQRADLDNEYDWPRLARESPWVWQLPVGVLALALLVLIGWKVAGEMTAAAPEPPPRRPPPQSPREQPDPPSVSPAEVTPAPPQESLPSPTPKVDPVPPKGTTPKKPSAVDPPTTTESSAPIKPETSPPDTPAPAPLENPSTSVVPAPLSTRRAVPDATALAPARTAMQEVYKAEFAAATTPALKAKLAEKLLADGRKYVGDDSNSAFALLSEARSTAIEIGHPKLLMEIMDELARSFELDPLSTKLGALHAVLPQLKAPGTHEALAEESLSLIEDALSANNEAAARELVELGIAAATKSGNRETIKELTARREELAAREQLQKKLTAAEMKLAENPSDAAAALLLGTHLCLTKDDWEAGLKLLANSGDAALAEAATADLAAPTDGMERVAVGDRWWTYSAGESSPAKDFRRRALHWYKLALPDVTGLTRMRVNNRLDETWTGPGTGPEPAIAPLTAEVARQRQTKWAQHLKSPVIKSNRLNMKLALIPPGQFRMGSADSMTSPPQNETPQHIVRITKSFYLSTTEVSVEQFALFAKETSYVTELLKDDDDRPRFGVPGFNRGGNNRNRVAPWLKPSYTQSAQHPVVNITYGDAEAFCKWLSQLEGVTYSLPTEAQWEYACRAGTETLFFNGDNPARIGSIAWHAENSKGSAQPTGKKTGNAWGLRDMHGNAAEWCADWYGEYTSDLAEDPTGPSVGSLRVVRGGNWGDRLPPRSALRVQHDPEKGDERLGFRVMAVVEK